MWLRLQQSRQLAVKHNEEVRDNYEQKYNKDIIPVNYSVGQEVFLDEHNFLHKNKKLAPQFSGPHIIEKLIGKTNAQIKLKNGRSTIIHLNRIKPFLSQSDKLIEIPKETANEQKVTLDIYSDADEENEDVPPLQQNFFGHPRNLLPTLATPPVTPPVTESATKRRRGRPPKQRVQVESERQIVSPPTQPPTQQQQTAPPPPRVTRSQMQKMSDEQKAEYFVAISFIDALKQLAVSSFKKKKTKRLSVKNKKVKNGSSNVKWTKLQEANFKTFGDTYGPTIYSTGTIAGGDVGAGNESDTESSDSEDSQSGSEHSDVDSSDHASHHSGGQSEHESDQEKSGKDSGESENNDERHESDREDPNQNRQPAPDSKSSSDSDEFRDAKEEISPPKQEGRDRAQEPVQAPPDKMAEREPPIAHRGMLPVRKDELPVPPGPRKPEQQGKGKDSTLQIKVPPSAISMQRPDKVSTRTSTHSPDTIPPSSVPTTKTTTRQAHHSGHVNPPPGPGTKNTTVLKMGAPTTQKDDKVRQGTLGAAGTSTGATAKPSVAVKRLVRPVQPHSREIQRTASDIGLMARIVGLTPSGLTREAKSELIGDLINKTQTSPDAMSALASSGSGPGLHASQHKQTQVRPKTPTDESTVKWASYRNQEEAKKTIEKKKARQEKEIEQPARPTRSNFKAPPILAPPKLALERQISKQLKEDKIKDKLDAVEKDLLEKEKKDKTFQKK
jgi:hypothetical protein